jgi:DNA-binding XRE family transcriptional regulator
MELTMASNRSPSSSQKSRKASRVGAGRKPPIDRNQGAPILKFSGDAHETFTLRFKERDREVLRRALLSELDHAELLPGDQGGKRLLRLELMRCHFILLDQRADLGLVWVQSITDIDSPDPKGPKGKALWEALRNAAVVEVVKMVIREAAEHGGDFLPPWNRELLPVQFTSSAHTYFDLGGAAVCNDFAKSRRGIFLGGDSLRVSDFASVSPGRGLCGPGSELMAGLKLGIVFGTFDSPSNPASLGLSRFAIQEVLKVDSLAECDLLFPPIVRTLSDDVPTQLFVEASQGVGLKIGADTPIEDLASRTIEWESFPSLGLGEAIPGEMDSSPLAYFADHFSASALGRYGGGMAKKIKRLPADVPIKKDAPVDDCSTPLGVLGNVLSSPVDLRDVDVRAIRDKVGMTQEQFAECFGLSVASLRNWEQHTRRPEQPIALYLRVIDKFPAEVMKEIAALKNPS